MEHYIQLVLTARGTRYTVPSAPISVPVSIKSDGLNKLLNGLLCESNHVPVHVDFSFFIHNEAFTSSLEEHISEKNIESEVIEVDYCEKQRAPTFSSDIIQEDLISCVKRRKDCVLTGSYDGTLQIWTINNPKCLVSVELEDKIKCVEWLEFSDQQATFVTGGFDQVARLWEWNRKTNSVTCVIACRGHSETVMSAAAQTNTTIDGCSAQFFATGSWDRTIRLWSATTEPTDLSEETGGIAHVRKSTGKLPTRIPRLTLAGHRETVTRVCWLPTQENDTSDVSRSSSSVVSSYSNQLISSSWDHTLRVWDCQAGGGVELRSIVSTHAIHDIDAALQGILVGSSDNRVRIFDLRASESLAQVGYHGHTGWLTAVAWAPHRKDQFVTGSIDRSVRLWDLRNTRGSLYDLMGHADMVTDVDWAPPVIGGHVGSPERVEQHFILSSSADGTVKIYDYPV